MSLSRPPAIAVIDVGKSNAKLALVDPGSRDVLAVRTTRNVVVSNGPYPHEDVDAVWRWLVDGLAELAREAEITTISVTAHGACFALLAGDALAMPVIDYEFTGLEAVHAEYSRIRGDFSEHLSPDLPNGLNVGRQIYWQSRTFPEAFAKVDALVPYPQYWVWRLTGTKVAETTSVGCHTDLWNPRESRYTRLAISEGWDRLVAPLANPWDTAGTLRPEVAAATGISTDCRVLVGIHDSNASLLPHLLTRRPPFAVLSTGTWMIVFAVGGSLDNLDPQRDCLANVDAFGRAVPSVRFMAGREYEIIAGGDAAPSDADVERIVSRKIMALPTFVPGTGPYGRGRGRWSEDPAALSKGERAAVASLYAALVTETCLSLAGAEGPIVVEGPFARNATFLGALAQRVVRPVIARPDATGTTDGAALLAFGPEVRPELRDRATVEPLSIDFSGYAAAWQAAVAARPMQEHGSRSEGQTNH